MRSYSYVRYSSFLYALLVSQEGVKGGVYRRVRFLIIDLLFYSKNKKRSGRSARSGPKHRDGKGNDSPFHPMPGGTLCFSLSTRFHTAKSAFYARLFFAWDSHLNRLKSLQRSGSSRVDDEISLSFLFAPVNRRIALTRSIGQIGICPAGVG